MSRPLQAIVFDFDGVIANSEPLHLLAFQQALAEDGVELSATDYYSRYLGYDDRPRAPVQETPTDRIRCAAPRDRRDHRRGWCG